MDTQFYVNCIVAELVRRCVLGPIWANSLLQTQAEEVCPDDASTQVHPIIEYVGGQVAQAGQANGGLDISTLDINVVAEWCSEAAGNCPTETGVIHIPDLRQHLHRIDPEYRWWLPPGSAWHYIPGYRYVGVLDLIRSWVLTPSFAPEMAPPPAPQTASTSASTSTSTCTSSRPRAPVTYADAASDANNDIEMEGGDTPRRKTRSSSKRTVGSPGSKAPDAQRMRVDDPVSSMSIIPNRNSHPG